MKAIKFILTNRVLLAFVIAMAIDVICIGINPWLYLLIFIASMGLIGFVWSFVYDGEKQSRSEEILLEWLERTFK